MARKAKTLKRVVLPDAVFDSKIVTKLINTIMIDGKKTIAQKILYQAFDLIKEKTKKEALEIFNKAISNVKPELEVRSRRIGGSNYQVPVEVIEERKITLALRWLVQYAQLRKEHRMYEKLANEVIDAANGVGATVKKKENTHKMAEANRAFAHFRW